MKIGLNFMTCLTKNVTRRRKQILSSSKTWYPAVHCAPCWVVSAVWQCGYRGETNQADGGERLDVTPVGFSLEIVLIGSCSAAAAQSLWVQLALCWFLLQDMYTAWALLRMRQGTGLGGGGVEGKGLDGWAVTVWRYWVGEPDRIRSVWSWSCTTTGHIAQFKH